MNANVKFQSLPIVNENSKIEVVLNADDEVTLRLSTWTENLGWCAQKTMSFDADMLEDLHRALTAAKLKVARQRAENQTPSQTAKVIAFPCAA